MIGELGALGCAPLWALSSILIKSQTDKIDPLRINAIRALSAAAFAVSVFLVTGRINQLNTLTLPAVFWLLLAVIVGFVVGDTLFIKGMGIIGVSKALPISIIYPIFVLPFSITVADEKLSILTVIGIFITATGLYLITAFQDGSKQVSDTTRKQNRLGIILVLIASLFWAGGTVILGFAMTDLDPILAGAIRMPFMAMLLSALVYIRKGKTKPRKRGPKSTMIIGLSGALGIGLGGLFFMIGVKYAGPAKTAILSTTAPLFAVPLSMFILREKITLKMILGTILCVIGIWFVI